MNNNTSKAFYIDKSNFTNNNLFQEMSYIDTCSLIDIFEKNANGIITEDYLEELIKNDGIVVWSEQTSTELFDFYHVNEYKKYAKANNIKGNHLYSAWKNAENTISQQDAIILSQNAIKSLEKVETYLNQIGMEVSAEKSDVDYLSRKIYTEYGGGIKDARHIAFANLNGINNIITQDVGFYTRYPSHNIFGASKDIMTNYAPSQKPAEYVDLNKFFLQKDSSDNEEDAS